MTDDFMTGLWLMNAIAHAWIEDNAPKWHEPYG